MTLLGDETATTTHLPAATVGVVWLDLSHATRALIPTEIEHRLTIDVGAGLPIGPILTYNGGRASVARRAPITIGPPLLDVTCSPPVLTG